MKPELLVVLLTGLFFGGYQLIARSAGKTDFTGTFIMAATAVLPIGMVIIYRGADLPSWPILKTLALSGMLMGIGFACNIWVITHPDIKVSTAVTVIAALVVLVVTVGGLLFFEESLSPRKLLGIVLAIAAIILLRPGH